MDKCNTGYDGEKRQVKTLTKMPIKPQTNKSKKCHTRGKTAVAGRKNVKKSRTQANKSNIDVAKNQEHKQHKGVLIHKLKAFLITVLKKSI